MSLFWSQRDAGFAVDLAARMGNRRGGPLTPVSQGRAQRQSVVWAALRLQSALISTLPLDVYRRTGGVQVEVPKPPVFVDPSGSSTTGTGWQDFMAASQWDMGSVGNTVGVIRAWDGRGLPAVIELAPFEKTALRKYKGDLYWVIDGREYTPREVWHECLYPVPGFPVGLSPIAYAAMSLNTHLSAQEFMAGWFGNSATPAQHLRNTQKELSPKQTADAKARFKAMLTDGDLFVSGSDWELKGLSAKASESAYIEAMDISDLELARFLGVPGDLVDVASKGSSITYANITERNLQFLIMHLGPMIARRETAFTNRLLPRPQYCKLNTAALMRMDPASQMTTFGVAIDKRIQTPSEVRAILDLPPLGPADLAEFAALWPTKSPTPSPAPGATP